MLIGAGLFGIRMASSASNMGVLLEIEGPIGPATSDYIEQGILKAQETDAEVVVIRMDTPGGLDSSMRDIIKAILSSPVPVAVFVAPEGSRAASAGTYILYASHVAAMAPATNLGAATPVPVGGSSPVKKKEDKDSEEEATGESNDAAEDGAPSDDDETNPEPVGASSAKAINDAVAYIRSLAERRGRNVDWAEKAVRQADSLSSSLATAGITLERVVPNWRTELLQIITNPTVAYLLMLIGIYGLLFEGYNPGAILPGVAGAICLILAAYAFQILPVNFAGLALIALGVILMISEVFVPSFGVLGIGGVIAFVAGSVILMDTDVPGFSVPIALIGSIGLAGAAATMAIVWFAVRARQRPVVSGREQIIGSIGEATDDFDGRGRIMVHGEIWTAECGQPVQSGDQLRVIEMNGLILTVRPDTDKEI
jgi:membrane-bound serine protease (ClpP class)